MALRLHVLFYLVDEPTYVFYVGVLLVFGYLVVRRLSQHSLNSKFGLIGSSLGVLSCFIFLFVSASKSWSWPFHDWQVYSLSLAVFTLLLGGILLSVSLAWALYQTARSRESSIGTR
jgi:hypothetical protein